MHFPTHAAMHYSRSSQAKHAIFHVFPQHSRTYSRPWCWDYVYAKKFLYISFQSATMPPASKSVSGSPSAYMDSTKRRGKKRIQAFTTDERASHRVIEKQR